MTPEVALHRKLGSVSRRIRLLLAYRFASRAALFSAAGCLLWLLASKAQWVEEPEPLALALIIGASVVLGALFGLIRRITPQEAARLVDKRTSMKERLASAIEFEALDAQY